MAKKQPANTPQPFLIDLQNIKIAVDVVAIAQKENELHVLLIQRHFAPFANQWAVPGGFVKKDELLKETVERVLRDETGLTTYNFIDQLGIFDRLQRDPRQRVISAGFVALLNDLPDVAGKTTDYQATDDAKWFKLTEVPKDLAFDHEDILTSAKLRLQYLFENSDASRWLMPDKFTLTQLQSIYEQIMGRSLEKRNFRKMVDNHNWLKPLNEKHVGRHRPAELYSFK